MQRDLVSELWAMEVAIALDAKQAKPSRRTGTCPVCGEHVRLVDYAAPMLGSGGTVFRQLTSRPHMHNAECFEAFVQPRTGDIPFCPWCDEPLPCGCLGGDAA